jgi:hypothetical protein
VAGMILLSRAVKDPKSSVAMNEWLDEKLDRRFEDFFVCHYASERHDSAA